MAARFYAEEEQLEEEFYQHNNSVEIIA